MQCGDEVIGYGIRNEKVRNGSRFDPSGEGKELYCVARAKRWIGKH